MFKIISGSSIALWFLQKQKTLQSE